MKKTELTSLLAVATLFLVAGSGYAAAQPTSAPAGDGPRMQKRQQFDLNKDGQIDDAERATAEAQMRDRLAGNPRFMERADTDKDDKISDSEWAVAKDKIKEHRQMGMQKKRMHDGKKFHKQHDKNRPGAGNLKDDPAFRHGFLLGKYDANHDGKLDETERAVVRADMEAKKRAEMENNLARLKSIDVDNDGKISDSEWAAAKEKFQKEHPGMKEKERHSPGNMPAAASMN